jgi:3-hydroxybutyryl-CoA dehydrogenase
MSAAASTVGVVGGGTMGVGIAYVFAAAGAEVTLGEPDRIQAEKALSVIRARAAREADDEFLDRISRVSTAAELPEGLDLAVEAVPERLELKRAVLAGIEERAPAILATSTSSISIGELAPALRRPESFLGLHFFNPVWRMPLVEIVRGECTASAAVAAAADSIAMLGKDAIVVRDVPGFATSRLGLAIGLEAMRMLEDGVASAADIDRAMELGYRHPIGPLRLSDVVGLDVRLDIAVNLAKVHGPRFEPPSILREKVAKGELGRKTGQGFYTW